MHVDKVIFVLWCSLLIANDGLTWKASVNCARVWIFELLSFKTSPSDQDLCKVLALLRTPRKCWWGCEALFLKPLFYFCPQSAILPTIPAAVCINIWEGLQIALPKRNGFFYETYLTADESVQTIPQFKAKRRKNIPFRAPLLEEEGGLYLIYAIRPCVDWVNFLTFQACDGV